MPTMIMAAPSRKQSKMLGETGAMLKQSTSMMAAMGRTACSASSSFSRSLGMDDLIMMSTSLSRPEAVPPGVGIENYFLIKYTKTDKSPSTKERLRLAKKQKCYKKKRLPRFCTAALKIRIRRPALPERQKAGWRTPEYRRRGRECCRRAEPSCRRPWTRPPFWRWPRPPRRCARP